ncbi:MAG: DUF3298 domain-containing protein [Paludibacteraceae bacterium]|nr:DUF3298 domain-containing protein [Paludibacteraceae bacterium]
MKKIVLIIAGVAMSLMICAQPSVQFKNVKKCAYYIGKEKYEAYGDEGKLLYPYQKNEINIHWPKKKGLSPTTEFALKRAIIETIYNLGGLDYSIVEDTALIMSGNVFDVLISDFFEIEEDCVPTSSKRIAKKDVETFGVEGILESQIKYQKHGVLSLQYDAYYIDHDHINRNRCGAISFDVERGAALELGDVIQVDSIDELIQLVNEAVWAFQKENEIEDWNSYVVSLEVEDMYDWYIVDDTLMFVFQKYDIAPGVYGVVELGIPVREHKSLFRPDALKYWGL